jgi:uncharacterized membrane protein
MTGVDFQHTIDVIEKGFQFAGVVVLVLGAVVALLWSGTTLVRHQGAPSAYQRLREGLGRAILVGLELLVAADIIHSVAIDPPSRASASSLSWSSSEPF